MLGELLGRLAGSLSLNPYAALLDGGNEGLLDLGRRAVKAAAREIDIKVVLRENGDLLLPGSKLLLDRWETGIEAGL